MMSSLPDRPRRQDLNRDIRARQQPLDPGTSVGFASKWPVARSPNCSVRPTPFLGMGPSTRPASSSFLPQQGRSAMVAVET